MEEQLIGFPLQTLVFALLILTKDLFIYGLSATEATAKIQEIFEAISEVNPNSLLCVRTAQSVSITSQFPFRHIQIILRLYKSPGILFR